MTRFSTCVLFLSVGALAGCSAYGAGGTNARPTIVDAPGSLRLPAKNSPFLAVPFAGSSSLGTFDAATGKSLTLIFGPKTKLDGSLAATTDSAGNLYAVSSGTSLGVAEFAAGADGNVAPVAFDKGLTASGIASDGSHVYISNSYTGKISEYGADPLQGKPLATLSGKGTKLCATYGIAVDAASDVYVTQQGFDHDCRNEVLEFAPLQPGNQHSAPLRVIGGRKTLVREPQGVAVDGGGNVYVADGVSDLVLEFGPAQGGNVKPAAVFGMGAYPYDGVAVDAAHDLFAGAPSGPSDSYGQIDVFDATNPARKPSNVFNVGKQGKQTAPSLIGL